MEVQVDTLLLLAQPKERQQQFKNKKQPELTENQTTWKSDNQGDKEETFIDIGRRGRDGQLGWRGLVARQWQADPSRCQIVEWGRQFSSQQTPWPCIQAQINREEWWGRDTDPANQGSSAGKQGLKPLIENTCGGLGGSRRNSQPHRRVPWRA